MPRIRLTLTGAVQGTGFRPLVHRLAGELGLSGWVRNTAAGVVIEVEGASAEEFRLRLCAESPPAAWIAQLEATQLPPARLSGFKILESEDEDQPDAAILPDLATCGECLAEIRDPGARRFRYPFTNCTRCGPRFTIVEAIPYDRPNTTMQGFALCEDCAAEYRDPVDRRFHAQPIACPVCGPRLSEPLECASEALKSGQIVALKGIGGYQLLVDARNEEAVARLRERKSREAKPFAVLAPDLDAVRALADISGAEAGLLESAATPIVLLRARPDSRLAASVSQGSPWVGVMLPCSPLHHLLLDQFPHPVVATSGNRVGEPICITKDEAEARLRGIADVFLHHDRPIARPCDDSVARAGPGGVSLLRRARGYAPLPVWIGGNGLKSCVLAVGGHLKGTVALHLGRQVVLSQHIGDLDIPEARDAFVAAIRDLERLYRRRPEVIACDLHPDYFSTVWAGEQGALVRPVQHHHAHVAACAAENGLEEPYLGVAWDGTGLGTDGSIWGGEFFLVEGGRFTRIGYLRPFFLPGGDAAMKEGERPAAGLLHELGETTRFTPLLERGVQSVKTTSLGRLFDAFAYIGGIAPRNRYEGEAGLRMEAAALAESDDRPYELPVRDGIADWRPMLEEFRRTPSPRRFHATLAGWIAGMARRAGVRTVALSGGCFQNDLLTRMAVAALEKAGCRAALHQRVPANDGGLALGQAVLAADERYAPE
ncbi:MAG: carbamoyltransferase HypF [Bryobacteraceae bacterium]|nr:carbamoyltransferase HypF [Solibacteraceae bacterium]MCO5349728.1 carbamoyltransferase HypF [Bryobacteraceae bacterium]